MNHERLLTPANKLKVAQREGVGEWVILVMGIKEGTCHNEH